MNDAMEARRREVTAMARTWVCACGAVGTQTGRGKLRKRCDDCRAGAGGSAPAKRDLGKPPTPPAAPSTRAALADADEGSRVGGRLVRAVRDDLDALITEHPMADGLRELALDLAGRLELAEDKTVPPLARELRTTLEGLASFVVPRRDDDDADDIDLSASVFDPPQP
jgi:hypothetical protein